MPQIPAELEPYELAYLRGGEKEVARLVVFSLIQRGYLEGRKPKSIWAFWETEKIAQIEPHPDPNYLSTLERQIFDWFDSPKAVREVFDSFILQAVRHHCSEFEERLQKESLLAPERMRRRVNSITILGNLLIIGLGAYKAAAAMSEGRENVLFLFVLGAVGVMTLAFIQKSSSARVSRLGEKFMDRLATALDQLKQRAIQLPAADPLWVLLVAVYGVQILINSPHQFYPEMFQRASKESGTGWNGDSSDTSCGGGGCGGCGGD